MENSERRFAELKQKFSPVLKLLDQSGAALQNLQIQDNKLLIRAAVRSQEARDHVMGEIGRVDPSYDEVQPDIRVGSGEDVPSTGQTAVQSNLEFSRD